MFRFENSSFKLRSSITALRKSCQQFKRVAFVLCITNLMYGSVAQIIHASRGSFYGQVEQIIYLKNCDIDTKGNYVPDEFTKMVTTGFYFT